MTKKDMKAFFKAIADGDITKVLELVTPGASVPQDHVSTNFEPIESAFIR